MTQELNKEGLEEGIAEVLCRVHARTFGDHTSESGDIKPNTFAIYTAKEIKNTIQAYLSHPKVTGFESRLFRIEGIEDAVNTDDDYFLSREEFREAVSLARDLQAALAGGGYD